MHASPADEIQGKVFMAKESFFFFPLFLHLKCWRIIAIAAHAYTISRDTPKLLMQILSTLSRIGKRIQILQLSPCSESIVFLWWLV